MAHPPEPAASEYRFGPFRLDLRLHQLFRDGDVVSLPPKAFDLLLLLVRHRDRVVERGEILRTVWPDAAATDDSLVVCVSTLRRALGDDSAHAGYVATVPKRGYRFVAPVVEHLADATPPPARTSAPVPSPRAAAGWSWRTAAAVVAALALAALGSLVFRGLSSSPLPSRPILLFQNAPPRTELASSGVVSPDGRYLVFLARDAATRQVQMWIRTLVSSDARMLPGTTGAMRPFWAPDSETVGFFAAGRLKAVPVGGGPVHEIAATRVDPSGASWGAGGTIIFADRVFGLFRVPAAGGEPQALADRGSLPRELVYRWPTFLPDGQRYLFNVVSGDAEVSGVYLGDLASSRRTRVLDGSFSSPVYVAPGYVLALRERTLIAQAVDPATIEPRGTPVPLVANVSPPGPLDSGVASVSTDGILAVGGESVPDSLTWFDRAGARVNTVELPVPLTNPVLVLNRPHQLLGTMNYDTQRGGVWFVDLQRGSATRLIERAGGAVSVSPDGDRIAFASMESGFRELYVRTTTARKDDLLVDSPEPKRLDHWSDDGRFVVYVSSNAQTQQDLWVVPVSDPGRAAPYLATRANEMHGRISPDGRWMAYTSDETGTWEVYVDSFPAPSLKRTVSVGGGAQPQWRADGGELFYLRPDRTIMAVAVGPGASGAELGTPQALFRAPIGAELTSGRNHYVAAPDGKRFLVRSASESDERQPIRVIVNWAALLASDESQ